jgi:acyl carrier protein
MTNVSTHFSAAVVAERTRAWLRDNLLYMQAESHMRDDDPLLSGGVIDSMGVIELVEFLQDTFEISITDVEITESNLGSIQSISRFVSAKCQALSGSRPRTSPQGVTAA